MVSSQESGHINLGAGGNVIMEGTMIASGRSGARNGWTVGIYPGGLSGHAWITGTIVTDGADNSATGPGGNAGDIQIISVQGNMVDATLSCNGGSANGGSIVYSWDTFLIEGDFTYDGGTGGGDQRTA